jgi:ubiquinol-cytochrome c reductase cytochrome c1 subunit
MRYSRTAEDIGIPVDVMTKNMLLATNKIGSTMEIAMRPQDAARWLGVTPPDLSVIARSRGADWLYTFLNSFYLDSSKETGVNNLLFKDTAMPHVLWELQGWQQAVHSEDDSGHDTVTGFELVSPGSMDEEAYKQATNDLVNYLVYTGEPAKLVRTKIGFLVILFLLALLVPAYKLKKEYWKDVIH